MTVSQSQWTHFVKPVKPKFQFILNRSVFSTRILYSSLPQEKKYEGYIRLYQSTYMVIYNKK